MRINLFKCGLLFVLFPIFLLKMLTLLLTIFFGLFSLALLQLSSKYNEPFLNLEQCDANSM